MSSWLILAAVVATGCPEFSVDEPRGPTVVVEAEKFGFSPTNDSNGAAIRRAVRQISATRGGKVVLAPGTYRCFDDEGVDLSGLKDFTLDGCGARLVFRRPVRHGPNRPKVDCNFRLSGCERVKIENLTLDWDWDLMPLGAFARVTAQHLDERENESYLDFELVDYSDAKPHPQFGENLPLLVCQAMDPNRRSFRAGRGGWCIGTREGSGGPKIRWLAVNRIRVWPSVMDQSTAYLPDQVGKFSPARNRDTVRGFERGGFYRLVHYYYGKGCFLLHDNRHVTLKNITIDSCFGGGVAIRGGEMFWQLIDFDFGQRPECATFVYPVTMTCDAHHVAWTRGYGKYFRCRWTRNLDDSCNFHDGAMLAEKIGPRTFCAVNAGSVAGFGPNTPIELFEANYDAIAYVGRTCGREGLSFTVDTDLPDAQTGLFLVRNRHYAPDNLYFCECDFTDGSMRNLFGCSQITLEKCMFRRMSGSPLRFVTEWTRNLWVEGTRATNIVVRSCTFDANQVHDWKVDGVTSEIYAGARPGASGSLDRATELAPGNQAVGRILVEKCRFVNLRGEAWYAPSGHDFVLRDNVVEKTDRGDEQ